MSKKIITQGLILALGQGVYISLVGLIILNGEKLFGKMTGIVGVMSFLLFFVLSAAISGGIILGKPILLYLDGKKIEAMKLFMATVGWLLILLIILLFVIGR